MDESVEKQNDSQPKVTHTCPEGYFRGNKSRPHELPPAILRAHHPRGSQLCPAQGPIARRDRREPRGGAAPPQPALPGAEPARQSRGRRQPPSCWEGEGRSPERRVPKRVGLSAAARDRGKGGGPPTRHRASPLGTCQTRAPPCRLGGGPCPTGSVPAAQGRASAVWAAANRDANPSTPISCLWNDSLGATRSAEMSSRPELATAEDLRVQANKQKVRGQNHLMRRE